MSSFTIVKATESELLDRGSGIKTLSLITPMSLPDAEFTTGISTYPVGQGAPLHSHDVDEQVTLLSGQRQVEVEGRTWVLGEHDTTYIPGDTEHAFRNTGNSPMTILWIYASNKVTRRFSGSDEEVEHLSTADMMSEEMPGSRLAI